MVGLPGLNEMPWTSTPGSPRLAKTRAVMSRALTELPAEKTSMSERASPSTAAARCSSKSSGTSPALTGTPPAFSMSAERV